MTKLFGSSSPEVEGAEAASMTPADATPGHWVSRTPASVQLYLRLARMDRPVGTWLLLWPCWWGVVLANYHTPLTTLENVWLVFLFGLGSVAMRGAGCTYNDIIDVDIDAQVARTQGRPLPSGQITVPRAWAFLFAQCAVGLFVLLSLNPFAIALGFASVLLVAAYPFMKRITWWPQAWLGLTFNWGVLMGWAAVTGELGLPALLLYIAGVFWTLGYDTIYAHQDKEDDALVGVRSSALALGQRTKPALKFFYGGTVLFVGLAGIAAGLQGLFLLGLVAVGFHFAWQISRVDIDNPDRCLSVFKANKDAGMLILFALLAGAITGL